MNAALLARPLLLEPVLVERPWGDQRLARYLGKSLPHGARIGESWETANEARVASGPLAGLTLGELVAQFGADFLGERGWAASQPFGDFPLLIKFIDADDVLSVQVHPDDEQARPLGQRGKTEAWYILAAEPGAELVVGLTEPLDPSTIRSLLAERRLADYLVRLPVRAGDTVIVPAGTLHAIGSGILLYEIQEQSDITYRFYDWDRLDAAGRGRPLHIEDGLAVLRSERQARRTQPLALDEWRSILTACRYFLLERWEVDGERHLVRRPDESPHLLSCIAGSVTIATADEALELTVGRTVLLPAPLSEIHLGGRGTLLAATVPDLWRDVVVPLQAAGYPDEAIARLCGDTSDLAQALARGAGTAH
ncbi:class I mannose-6-phosphate isomerase [Thermomicrobium sp. 4228-Ro]|uniref:type I phosphomannose isomerase catalytic subunit n=1 Tax=Thermomicrobium sp. 4228-Ro TaxID=2993937 RepID=UPI0022489937|nr:type I phosphomannose isomerase catalytic subunit [Thermomicrobium sp. 4228-Ro]MCX2728503.1 class I mannose-6-phosphate isomerase [Thermomicrobium sp. 4228-Ro]